LTAGGSGGLVDGTGVGWLLADTESSIPARFARVVEDRPEHPAIAGGDAELTYRELDALADGFLGAFRDRGLPETGGRAALLMHHDGPLLAAALAVLRGGGAVVTLNPTDPAARLAEIREAVSPALLVSDEQFLDRARAAGFPERQILTRPCGPPSRALSVEPDALAFLICTSGSSGRPKIVMQTHRNMLHNILRYTNGLGVSASERIAWLASLSGMQGIVTAWCALMNGATLCPFPLAERGLLGLDDWLERERITLFDALPSILRSVDRALPDERTIAGVRLVRLGSEPALRGDLAIFRRRFGSASTLASVFGSSEAGTMAQKLISPADEPTGERLSVGRETDGIEIRLHGEGGQPVQAGEVGEIVVYGEHLSPGYWRDEGLTAERFQTVDGRRCYRSGDLGRRDQNGELTVVGRTDRQVKVRGHAVQLEEVEAALARQPGVAAAVVRAEGNEEGHPRLIAYVYASTGIELSAPGLGRALALRLPSQAIPAEVVVVSGLPLNANGKVDRARLAELGRTSPKVRAGRIAGPETEELLGGIWAEAFERDWITPGGSFLELGGDSLTAAVIAARVYEEFGVEFDLGAFDGELTIASMASLIEDRAVPSRDGGEGTPPPPRHEADAGPAPLSFAQRTIWRQAPKKGAGFNGAAAFRVTGGLDVGALRGSLERIVRRHEALRTGFVMGDGEPVAVVHPSAEVQLPFADLSAEPDPQRRALEMLAADARIPFDLGAPPLLRLRLLRLGPDEHWLLRTIHHIVSDALSWRIFVADLAAIYPALRQGRESPLPEEPPLQMGDYARWERRSIDRDSSAFKAEVDWWQRRLDPRPPPIVLPFARASQSHETSDADGVVEVANPPGVSAMLDGLGGELGATYFMTRLALFSALIGLETETHDLTIDTYLTLRGRAELRSTFGPLINQAVIRLRFRDDISLEQWVSTVRSEIVDLSRHASIPFDVLLEELRARGVGQHALGTRFQIDEEPARVEFDGLALEPLPRDPVRPWAFRLMVKRTDSGERWQAVFDPQLHDPAGVEHFLIRMRALALSACAEPRRALSELHAAIAPRAAS
jgi:amino acid adenylation domain-containing protein